MTLLKEALYINRLPEEEKDENDPPSNPNGGRN